MLTILLVTSLGMYFLLRTQAAVIQTQLLLTWGTVEEARKGFGHKTTNGQQIHPSVSLSWKAVDKDINPATAIVSLYYISSQLDHSGVSVTCDSGAKCTPIKLPFDTSIYHSSGKLRYDRMFSICVDLPRITTGADWRGHLFHTNFTVKNSSDAIQITLDPHAIYADASCAVNGGKSDVRGNYYDIVGGLDHRCYNQDKNKHPGANDGNYANIDCGYTAKFGNPVVVTAGTSGSPNNGSRQKSTGDARQGSGSGGGSSGSIAKQQSNKPNSLPKTSQQGTNKQPELQPSPFFDGKQYKPGSEADTKSISTLLTNTSKTVAKGLPFAIGAIAIAGTGFALYWRYWRK